VVLRFSVGGSDVGEDSFTDGGSEDGRGEDGEKGEEGSEEPMEAKWSEREGREGEREGRFEVSFDFSPSRERQIFPRKCFWNGTHSMEGMTSLFLSMTKF